VKRDPANRVLHYFELLWTSSTTSRASCCAYRGLSVSSGVWAKVHIISICCEFVAPQIDKTKKNI